MKKYIKIPALIMIFVFMFSCSVFADKLSVDDMLKAFTKDTNTATDDLKDDVSITLDSAATVGDILKQIQKEPSNLEYYDRAAELYTKEKKTGIIVFTDGTPIDFSKYDNVEPVIIKDKNKEDRTMIPARALSENMGGQVDWDGVLKQVKITIGSKRIELTLDSDIAKVNGSPVKLDVPAQIINGRTLIPLRFVSENFSKNVGWHPYTNGARVISITD